MNREEKERHIGQILLAEAEGKEILYCGGAFVENKVIKDRLVSEPESYQIKPEPRAVYINIHPQDVTAGMYDTEMQAQNAVENDESGVDFLIVGYKIELPGEDND